MRRFIRTFFIDLLVGACCLSVLSAGCAATAPEPATPTHPAAQADARTGQDDPPLTERELTGMTRNRSSAQPAPPAGPSLLEEDEPAQAPVLTPAPALQSRSGFRIQIFSLQDKAAAERARQDVQNRLEDLKLRVYIEIEAPYYKIRVGDYAAKVDADAALRILKTRKGFKDAWIVRTTIN